MFKKDYKKKIEKLIAKKIAEMTFLQQLTEKYKKEGSYSKEKVDFVSSIISEIGKEVLKCKTETEFSKEIYEKHKNNFNEIVKRKEKEYYGTDKKEKE